MRVLVTVLDVDRRNTTNQILASAGVEPVSVVAQWVMHDGQAQGFTLPATSDASEQHQYQVRIRLVE